MVTPELLDFIRAQHKEGISKEDLEHLLVSEGGWKKEDIDEAYDEVLKVMQVATATAPPIITLPPPTQEVSTLVTPPPLVFSPPVIVAEEKAPLVPKEEILPATPPEIVIPATLVEEAVKLEVRRPEVLPTFERKPLADTAQKISLPEIKHEEDFLGIFHETPSIPTTVDVPVSSLIIKPQAQASSVEFIPSSIVTPEVKEPIVVVSPVVTPPVTVSPPPIILDEPVAPAPAEVPATTGMGTVAPAPFKFDFSKIRTPNTAQPVPPVSQEKLKPAPFASSVMTPEAKAPLVPPVISRFGSPLAGENKIEKIATTASLEDVAATPTLTSSEKLTEVKNDLIKNRLVRRTMASDLLFRGVGTTVSGIPAINPPPEKNIFPEPIKKPEEEEKVVLPPLSAHLLAPEIKKKHAVKRTIALSIAVLALLAVLGIALFIMLKLKGPSATQTSVAAFTQFFNTESFSYKGKASADLILSTALDGVSRTGIAKFDMGYEGSLKNSPNGYGDGVHRTNLSAELSAGDFTWKTATPIETDVRVIGSSLYFQVLSFPSTSNLEPELFKTYWVKIDLSEIAKELALSGVSLSGEGYGTFGGQSGESTFSALLRQNNPFEALTVLSDDELNGVKVHHVKMETDPEKMLIFTSSLYQKYSGKKLLLTKDQRIRFLDALKKINGEAWISQETGALLQVSFSADFDDDIVDVRVKGPVNLLFTFADFNKPVIADIPTPILTLEELKVRMEDFKNSSATTQRDQEKKDHMTIITDALNVYKSEKGRFPTTLSELYSTNILRNSIMEESKLKPYTYVSYVSEALLTKANRCTAQGKFCTFYHIGVNVEDTQSPLLVNDADVTSDVRGADRAGCAGEKGVACYDRVSPPPKI